MENKRMRTTLRKFGTFYSICVSILVGASGVAPTHAQTYPFSASDVYFQNNLNTFWYTYGENENSGDSYTSCCGLNSVWTEWDAMKFDWTAYGGYRTTEINYLENSQKINGINGVTGVQPTGYVWSWGALETWPDNNSYHAGLGSYHFDQIPRYINAIYDNYMWTRDSLFISTMLPRAEVVMDSYLLGTMQGNSGTVVIIPLASNDGTAGKRPSTYMDQVGSGYKDAWVNTGFYTALRDMAEMETANGNTTKAATYQSLANTFPSLFESTFWNSTNHRYGGWRDTSGVLHDYGYTYINLEALARGLGNATDANYIFGWLNGPADATSGGAHAGSTSMNQDVFGPRTNSISTPNSYWDGWSDPSSGRLPYGSLVEDGGSVLWEVYYDVMAHLRYDNADDAMAIYQAMLLRMISDSHLLTFNQAITPQRVYDDFGDSITEIGTSTPYPESGIAGIAFLNGFLGVTANLSGLNVSPNLPSSLFSAQVTQVNYKGTDRTIEVSRGTTVLEQPSNNSVVPLTSGTTLSQQFTPSGTFNEIGVDMGTYLTTDSGFLAQLYQWSGSAWVKVASRTFVNYPNNQWQYMAFPVQPGGSIYSLNISNVSGNIAWDINTTSSIGGAYQNGASIAGAYTFRVGDAGETAAIRDTTQNTADSLSANFELAQTFTIGVPFNRASMHVGTYVTQNSGFTANLYQSINGDWVHKVSQQFDAVVDNSDVTMNFASMPAGTYKLEMTKDVGSIAWYRDTTGTYSGGSAINNGVTVPGRRRFSVYQGQYNIQVPEKDINTTINAGDTYTMTN